MKRNAKTVTTGLFLLLMLLVVTSAAFCEEHEPLKGVKSAKAVFDIRMGDAQKTALHIKLLHQTYKDLIALNKKPVFVLVFMGPSVKLISKNREGFKEEDQKALDEIANTISQISKDGIKLEICLTAARVLGVDPASILPEIKAVDNGWVSAIGYQAQGYSLVPVY